MGTAGSSEYDQGAWDRAREVLDDPDLSNDARVLSPGLAMAVALRLSEAGWSYRAIAPALGVSKSTIGRWFTEEHSQPGPPQTGEGIGLVGLLLGAGAVAAILKATLGREPRQLTTLRFVRPRPEGTVIRGPWPPRPADDDGETP